MTPSLGPMLYPLALAIFGALLVILAVITWRRGGGQAALRYWGAFCFLAGLWSTSLLSLYTVHGAEPAAVISRVAFVFAALSFVALLRFVLIVAEHGRGRRALSLISLCWGGLLAILFGTTELMVAGVVAGEYIPYSPVAGPLMPLYGGFFLFTWIGIITVLVQTLRQRAGHRRTQAAYLLVAFAVACVAALGTLLPSWLGTPTLLAALPALLLPVFPLTITYAIIRHRLWDIRTIIHRTAMWLLLVLLLAGPVYGILWLGGSLWPRLGRLDQTVLLSLLFLLGYVYLRAVQPRLDHLFQRRAYDRQRVVEAFARTMTGVGRPVEVADALLGTIERSLYPERAAVLFPRSSGEWRRATRPAAAADDAPASVAPAGAFLRQLTASGAAVEQRQVATDPQWADVRDEAVDHLAAAEALVCVPLVDHGRLIGLVHLGERRTLGPYTRGDLELLEQLAAAAAIGLANALLFDRVDRQRQDLETLASTLESRVQERTEELAAVNQQLTRANVELRSLDQLKSRFFANISHELRTPLTLILLPVEAALGDELGELGPDLREALAGARTNALELLELINDLLDLSRLEESRLRLQVAPLDLTALVNRITDYARPLAERKQLVLEVTADPTTPTTLEGDERKLERVIVNLLSNACKFTEPGGRVTVAVAVGAETARVSVTDTGIGIPAEELPHVFDRFRQVDTSTTRRHGGSGLGLALARELAELHGGRLAAASTPGEGSCFTLEIPRTTAGLPPERLERRRAQQPVTKGRREDDRGLPEWSAEILGRPEYRFLGLARATERRVAPRADPDGFKAARILVADDKPEVLQYLQRVLGDQFEVWCAQDGTRAWELVREHRHDLVVADVMMPGMSGLELCHRIKSDPRLQDTPVILLTARAESEHRIEGHRVGADEYLTKPFRVAELRAAVNGLLSGRARRTEVSARRRSVSLDTLLAGMAHELRNAVHQVRSAQSALVALARKAADPDAATSGSSSVAQLGRMEDIAQRAVGRVAQVVDSLQRYAGDRMQDSWTVLALDELVRQEVNNLTDLDLRGIELRLDLDAGAQVRGPHEALRQVVLNIIENAAEAVTPPGQVSVETQVATGRVRLSVRDSGRGIPAADRERVFDLFFTTKDPGRGMGLGLALCQRTVQDLGGTIALRSQEGVGTEVVVELPLAAPSPALAATDPEPVGDEESG